VNAERKDNTWTFSNNGLTLIKGDILYDKWPFECRFERKLSGLHNRRSAGDTKISIGTTNLELVGGVHDILGYLIIILLIKKKDTENTEIMNEGILHEKTGS